MDEKSINEALMNRCRKLSKERGGVFGLRYVGSMNPARKHGAVCMVQVDAWSHFDEDGTPNRYCEAIAETWADLLRKTDRDAYCALLEASRGPGGPVSMPSETPSE